MRDATGRFSRCPTGFESRRGRPDSIAARDATPSQRVSRLRDLASVAKQRVLPRRGFPFVHAIEEPSPSAPPAGHTLRVKGWLLLRAGATAREVAVEHGGRTALSRVDRPDIAIRWPGHEVVGFQGLVAIDPTTTRPWRLTVTTDASTYTRDLDVEIDDAARARFPVQKARKLERLEPLLRCPRPAPADGSDSSCLGELTTGDDETMACTRCGTRFGRDSSRYDFLTEELREIGAIDTTDAISSWGYDPIATELIEECRGGLVLDAGSGLKAAYLDDVVNLEVVDYPTTDVLAIGERLPFADESFDAALSLVVLEHVRDPFRCAAEIGRVVKPGGRIYVAVPFLQPYHGYPHHYYNMTRRGLEQLFADAFEIERCDTAPYGHPVFTLTWFLQSYLDGLPKATARKLADMRVRDLLGDGHGFLADSFVTELAAEAVEELACSNYLLGTKR